MTIIVIRLTNEIYLDNSYIGSATTNLCVLMRIIYGCYFYLLCFKPYLLLTTHLVRREVMFSIVCVILAMEGVSNHDALGQAGRMKWKGAPLGVCSFR